MKKLLYLITSYQTYYSILRTIIFTGGHFCIDIATNYYITGAPLQLVAISAFLSPMLNAVWYFILDRYVFLTIFKDLHLKYKKSHRDI